MALNTRTLLFSGVGAVALAALIGVAVWPEPVPVDLHTVTRGPMEQTVNADGKTRIRDIYDVYSPISGTAQRAPVAVGDTVTQGETVVAVVQPVAPALLDRRTRLQAEAAVQEAQSALRIANSQYHQANEELSYARSQFDRTQTLVTRGVASVTQLEDAAQRLEIKKAALETAASGLAMANSALSRAQAALIEPNGAAPPPDSCCVRIHAPISGSVLAVDVISEHTISAGTRLVSIGQTDNLEIVADLLSSDAVRLAAGADTVVERWGGPVPLYATLRSVDPSARTKVSALGIEEQRVEATFDLTSPPQDRAGLADGFAVFLRITEWRSPDELQAPLSALFRHQQDWAVFTAQDGRARLTPVRIGRRNGTFAQVLGGLEPGQPVITHPSDQIADGVRIIDRKSM